MAENIENNGCSQRDSAEHEGYAKASRSFNRIWKEREIVSRHGFFFIDVRLAAHVSKGLKSRIRPVVGRI